MTHCLDLVDRAGRPLYVRSRTGNLRRAQKRSKGEVRRVRVKIYERDGFMCQECGYVPTDDQIHGFYDKEWSAGDLELDHIKAYRDGGQFTPRNLRTLCGLCNRTKGTNEVMPWV